VRRGIFDLNTRVSQWENSELPGGQRVYAIGDIHGRADLLDAMLELIQTDDARRPRAQTALVFLGDYIDRGPHSKEVIDRLTSGLPPQFRPLFLKGNHEDFLLTFLRDPYSGLIWLRNGGDSTLLSYGVAPALVNEAFSLDPFILKQTALRLQERLPREHRAFFETLKLFTRFQDYFFVHAGVKPGVALDRQAEDDLLWIRDEFLNSPSDFGAVVVHGHTPAPSPEDLCNRIGIDTYAWKTGRLTAVGLEGSRRWFLST
jgi:serine/threonine protein phosphatase 1